MSIFVGRKGEQGWFKVWLDRSDAPDERAALLVGSAGMGKSALLRRYERMCLDHPAPRRYVQRIDLNANESAAQFFERLIHDARRLFRGKPLRSEPNDRKLLRAMLKSVPGAGTMLAALIADVKHPGWLRFIDYAKALSASLAPRGERYVLLIDPDRAMDEGQADEWLSVAKRLPEAVRLAIAQRPDDVIAAHPESQRLFQTVKLDDLDEDRIAEWYEAEFVGGRLAEFTGRWSGEVRLRLPRVAFERYRGYPVAHDAVVRLLATEPLDEPLAAVRSWPRELEALMEILFKRLAACGDERLRAALTLQVFQIGTPLETWAEASGMTAEALLTALCDPRFRHFFAEMASSDGRAFAPFHALFAERLERELAALPRRREELAESAWQVIQRGLDPQTLRTSIPNKFELLAATPVADRFSDTERFLRIVDLVCNVKQRVGLLDAAESDLRRADQRTHSEPRYAGAIYGNLGLIHWTRGELDEAQRMHRKSLAIEEKLGRPQGMAAAYGNLGLIHQTRGALDEAERMHRKALEIEEQLGRMEGMARQYGNLGLIHEARGELDEAERMLRKALEINEKLGRLEGMAAQYGNLGLIHQTRGDLDEAERMHRKSLEIEEKLGRLEGMAAACGNLGLIHQTRGDLDQAERRLRKTLEINEKLGRLEGMAETYGNLGVIHKMRGDLDEAERMQHKALEIDEKLDRLEGMAAAYGNLGLIHQSRGDLDEAERMHRKSLEVEEKLGRLQGMAAEYANLGSVQAERGDIAAVRGLWTKARELYARIGMPYKVAKCEAALDRLPPPEGGEAPADGGG